jgi:hypothetical protein
MRGLCLPSARKKNKKKRGCSREKGRKRKEKKKEKERKKRKMAHRTPMDPKYGCRDTDSSGGIMQPASFFFLLFCFYSSALFESRAVRALSLFC